LFLDFDGVLADIVPSYDRARPRPAVPELLSGLVAALGRVAVVSGRPVSFLAAWLPAEVDLVGLYGLEWRTDGHHHVWNGAERWRGVIDTVGDDAVAEFGSELVEPKGLSLTVHYRDGDVTEDMVVGWARRTEQLTGLECRGARMSVELHPPVDRDKGTALLDLATGLATVAFMGDDIGDLPAFDALDRLAGDGIETIRIAVGSSEVSPRLLERADLVVEGPAGAETMLRELVDLIDGAGSSR
jgi:trehalose 6-phosphate phosphatase